MSTRNLFAVAIAFCLPSVSFGTVVIDNFDAGGQQYTVTGNAFNTETVAPVDNDPIGDTREYRVFDPVTGTFGYGITGSNFYHNTNTSLDAVGTGTARSMIRWDAGADFAETDGLPGVDLTEGGTNWGLRLNTTFLAGSPTVEVRLKDGSGGEFTSTAQVFSSSVTDIYLAQFVLAGVDLTDIVSIEMFVENTSATDGVAFSLISTVPEPSTIGLLGMAALGGVWFARRRRNQNVEEAA